jgi:hypothetical protein
MDEIVKGSKGAGSVGFRADPAATADVGATTAIQSQRLSKPQRRRAWSCAPCNGVD